MLKLLGSNVIADHLGTLPDGLRTTFLAAFDITAEEGATVEVLTSITLPEAQQMLKDARVSTSSTDERPPTGLELGLMMAPLRRLAREIDRLEAAARAPPQAIPVQAAAPTAQDDNGHNKFTDVVAHGGALALSAP